jgi:replicative DNA helicase
MHLHDLLGDREAQTGATLGLGKRAIDLVELIEYAGLLLLGDPWAGVNHADVEVAVHRLGGDTDLACVGKLYGVMKPVKGKAEVIIAKQRHGAIGSVQLHFDGSCMRFSDLAYSGHHGNGER